MGWKTYHVLRHPIRLRAGERCDRIGFYSSLTFSGKRPLRSQSAQRAEAREAIPSCADALDRSPNNWGAQRNLNDTVMRVTADSGMPFRRPGVYSYCCTAFLAASSNTGCTACNTWTSLTFPSAPTIA